MKKVIARIACGILFFLGTALVVVTNWYCFRFDTSFSGLLFTLTTPVKGVGTGTGLTEMLGMLPWLLGAVAVYAALLALCARYRKKYGGEEKERRWKTAERCVLCAGVLVLLLGVAHTWFRLNVTEYIRNVSSQTTLYEDHYVAPDSVAITRPEQKPNVICLFLESMETTYASREDGGMQPDHNFMPNLTLLAQENVSFSDTDRLGGFLSMDKTNWTMAALFGATSGLPFAFPVGQNSMNKYTAFAPEIITLGDILREDGYTQEFLCGSDATYGGRALYFSEHGDYAIYDLFTARENGDLPSADYYEWWGYEDHYLFSIARKELTRLYESGEPFNLTLLTVDAHHLGGYLCAWCGNDYEDKTANVIACTDRQVAEFVAWCREQPFWENTVMIICGDHPRMDTSLTEGVPYQKRSVYNCFLNARAMPGEGADTFRTASVMDLFPTTLAAMGYRIEGDRLGLGTNLFSGRKTLAEEMGYETLNTEVQKYSRYFVTHFAR